MGQIKYQSIILLIHLLYSCNSRRNFTKYVIGESVLNSRSSLSLSGNLGIMWHKYSFEDMKWVLVTTKF